MDLQVGKAKLEVATLPFLVRLTDHGLLEKMSTRDMIHC